jgi:tetratricopeptide (TPR) repeat protein
VFSASRVQQVAAHRSKVAEARHHKHTSAQYAKRHARVRHSERHRAAHAIVPSASVAIERPASLPPDLAAVKQAIELMRQRKPREATALATSIGDQLMQKLVEWALLRQPESDVGFERYAAFISANPDWPSIPLFRRRAEVRLSHERDPASARRLVSRDPTSSVERASEKREVRAAQDADKRWRERRLLARKLIDLGDAKTAYRVVREAAPPSNPYYRAEFHFMAGWIALRFLRDPSSALEHFGHVDEGSSNPIVHARAAYWRGRAAEAAGEFEEMRAQYEAAARYPTAYYGQLARARLGLEQITTSRSPPEPGPGIARELQRAADILYSIGERDLAVSFMTDVAEDSSDVTAIAALGQLTAHYNDARAMLLIGKAALARGFAMEQYAFPDIGVPPYGAIGPQLDRCIVYSIARTEAPSTRATCRRPKQLG